MYHLESPVRQEWHEVLGMLAPFLQIDINNSVPLKEWITQVEVSAVTNEGHMANPAQSLLEFYKSDFERMAGGDIKLDMSNCLKASPSLRKVDGIPASLLAAYVDCWRSDGFLN